MSLLAGWESFSVVELVGYVVLTYAIYQFNNSEEEQGEKLEKDIKELDEKEMDLNEIERLTEGEIEV